MNAWEPIAVEDTPACGAFGLWRAAADGQAPPTPLVFASPHSGRDYPEDMMAAAALDAQTIRRSEDAFVDDLTWAVANGRATNFLAHEPRTWWVKIEVSSGREVSQ